MLLLLEHDSEVPSGTYVGVAAKAQELLCVQYDTSVRATSIDSNCIDFSCS
jgi:hypothetical protein